MNPNAPNAMIARVKKPPGAPNAVIAKGRNRGQTPNATTSPRKNGLTSLFKEATGFSRSGSSDHRPPWSALSFQLGVAVVGEGQTNTPWGNFRQALEGFKWLVHVSPSQIPIKLCLFVNSQEWPRQTKPKKGQFMNFSQGHSGTKVQCESRLFS